MSSLMIDVHGTSLTADDRDVIAHPKVGGLILFSRNFESIEQLIALNKSIKSVNPNLLIAVDHEGGRVQRFREGFSKIPAMGKIYQHANTIASNENVISVASNIALHMGYLMAVEVQSVGIDISFAPVLDIDDISDVIGDRGFHKDPDVVTSLANEFIKGMKLAGMKATGKHFPGHGSVKEDSHIAMPVDNRAKQDIFSHDMLVFKNLIQHNQVDALMPAHVIYPQVDALPVGFSPFWLQTVLREQLGFEGVIFSDDLSMQGATTAGGYAERCEAAYEAGCDMLLVCNDRNGAIEAIDKANIPNRAISIARVQSMLNQSKYNFAQLKLDPEWQKSQQYLF
ncbi:beta-N-acetylhexosaminidase [Thalassotalea psychrophila]|uniref:Beta-hexosaminidase n=1 Tax=Thalassotalea psychrophila TaxID=3065647 RepID=A0ABY9U174_9GAMM|nr:beta-N-acetylhexosaminidase [Colwelliaceae bacterium SQ149]